MHEKSPKTVNLALFDFDGTLCDKDSFTGFIFFSLKPMHIIRRGLKILPWILAYYCKLYPASKMRPKLYATMFRNQPSTKIESLAKQYSQQLQSTLNPSLFKQLKEHQKNGDRVVLVSASLDLYLTPLCEALNIDLICTETEMTHQYLTGHYSSLDCSHHQKSMRVLAHYQLSHYRKIYAYGNHEEDLEMLKLADFDYFVGRDHQLPQVQ